MADTVTAMRLSTAIRLGAMLGPQAFGRTQGPDNAACALGAALQAIGQRNSHYAQACTHWPLLRERGMHPVTGECDLPVLTIVLQLNDVDQWTRERVADWIATMEAQTEMADVPSDAATVIG